MASWNDADDNAGALMLRPEDLLHACVAYTRPEMHALNQIITLRSSGTLSVNTPTRPTKPSPTLASLPPEVLLRVRAELQAALVQSIARETADALDEYEAALVDGLCADCFWWNHDIYGEDVWAWVENGYREACKCCVSEADADADANDSMKNVSSSSEASASALVSAEKARVARKYAGLEIFSRRQWLDAHISRTYLPEPSFASSSSSTTTTQTQTQTQQPWRGLVKGVLARLGCECSAELEEPYDPTLGPAFASRYVERRRALQCSFGTPVGVAPLFVLDSPASASASTSISRRPDDDPAVTLRRVVRELQVYPPAHGDEPFRKLEGSSLRFAHKLQKKLCKPSEHYFRIEWHPSCNCMDCLLNLYPRAPRTNGAHIDASLGLVGHVARTVNELADRSIELVSSSMTCALSVCALLVHRMLTSPTVAIA